MFSIFAGHFQPRRCILSPNPCPTALTHQGYSQLLSEVSTVNAALSISLIGTTRPTAPRRAKPRNHRTGTTVFAKNISATFPYLRCVSVIAASPSCVRITATRLQRLVSLCLRAASSARASHRFRYASSWSLAKLSAYIVYRLLFLFSNKFIMLRPIPAKQRIEYGRTRQTTSLAGTHAETRPTSRAHFSKAPSESTSRKSVITSSVSGAFYISPISGQKF